MGELDKALSFIAKEFDGDWINTLEYQNINDDYTSSEYLTLERNVVAKLINASTELYEYLNFSVLSGEYVIDISEYRQKIGNLENEIKKVGENIDIADYPNVTDAIQSIFSSNFYNQIKESLKRYKSLLDFVENHLSYQIDTSIILYVISKDVDSSRENKSVLLVLSDLFELNANLAEIDHSISFTKDYFRNLLLIRDQLQKRWESNNAIEILIKKCNFLLYKISFRLKESKKNYLYAIDFNYSSVGQKAESCFEYFNDIINGHYYNGFNLEHYISRQSNAIKKYDLNNELSLDEFHALIKYFKDEKQDIGNLKQLRTIYELFYSKYREQATQFDKKAFDIMFCYLENNLISLELEKGEFDISNWENKFNDSVTRAEKFKNNNYFPYKKIINEYLITEINKQFLNGNNNLSLIEKLLLGYERNLKELIKNVGICEEIDYLAYQGVYYSCIVCVLDSSGIERKCFISSSFVLPLNYNQIKEELEQLKSDLNKFKSMYEIQKITAFEREKINKIVSANREDIETVKIEIEKTDKRHIEILSIFAAIVMFVSSEIQFFAKMPNMADAVIYTLFFAFGLGVFVLLIWLVTRPNGLKKEDFKTSHKIVFSLYGFGLAVAIFYSGYLKLGNTNQNKLDDLQYKFDSLKKTGEIDSMIKIKGIEIHKKNLGNDTTKNRLTSKP